MTSRLLLGFGVLLALACGGGGRAKPVGTPALDVRVLPEIGLGATDDEVQRYVDLLVPYVERAAGARFTAVPRGLAGTPEALSGIFEEETRGIIGRIYDVPPSVVERMAQSARGGVPGILGKYAAATKAVYFVPGAGAHWAADGPEAVRARTLLVMAHELAHALLDEQANFDNMFDKLEDLEHFDGFRGITEGHANWVTLRVARDLALEDEFWALSAGQGWGKAGLIEPGAFQIFMLYGQGMAFCDHHAADSGPAALWKIVREPPRTTTMLFRPERYAPDLVPEVDLAGQLSGIEQTLTRADWVPADTLLGEGRLRKETLGLDAARVEAVLGSIRWGHERQVFFEGDAGVSPRRGNVSVIGFADGDAPKDLIALLSDALAVQADARSDLESRAASAMPGFQARKWSVTTTPYDKIQGEAVLLRVVGPVSESGARLSAEEEQALFVVRGRVLVTVSVAGFRPGNRLDKTIEEVFRRIPERSQGSPDAH